MPQNNNEILTELRGDMKLVLSKMEDAREWRKKHEEQDEKNFALLHRRVSAFKMLLAPFGVVLGLIGYLWGK